MSWGPGHEFNPDLCDSDVHNEFGLTYAAYLVWPRSLMQEMPADWQHRFHVLCEEMAATWRLDAEYAVLRRGERNRFVKDPLRYYRRPDGDALEAERVS